ncbi:MAG TPA: bifunctional nuclease family protein, partial [Thermodesulfobacteriota bacterium]|nr:bifunctional nuclease family protein [Thermodesulfobacteriota bacterium]
FDKTTETPVVLLTDKSKKTVLPIWIGLCEARSIEIGLSGAVPPRPLTYDLVAAMLRTLNAEVRGIEITDLRDRVFYARVVLSVNGKISKIDARPSDALALASRMNSPIFVDKSVIKKAALVDPGALKREL